ncbi:MAG: putative beta-barrel porin 2 [Acidobacteria bacterium]|nr:putative beta-barrel porin 2 [Acidobacteriota bacterium]
MVVVAAVLASPLAAQSTQYVDPGSLGTAPLDRREALRTAVEEARWQAGPVRVEPWLSLREVAWVEQADADGRTSGDLTVSVGAGLAAYLPLGAHTTLAAQVLPEYIWWREREDESRLAGRYGAGAFVYGNHLALEILARSTDSDTVATPELPRRVPVQDDRLEARVEVPFTRALALFARGELGRYDTGDHDEVPELALLDRDDRWWIGGLRWSITPDLTLAAGAGASRAEFDEADALRSHRGTTTYGEVAWRRPKLDVSAELFATELEADGSTFPGVDDTFGSARVHWRPRETFGLGVYALRALAWSIEPGRTGYVDRRWGAQLELHPGWRTSLYLFVELGEQRYDDAAAPPRTDDVDSLGLGGSFELGRGLSLTARARRTRTENAALGLDRELTEVRAGIAFGRGGRGGF